MKAVIVRRCRGIVGTLGRQRGWRLILAAVLLAGCTAPAPGIDISIQVDGDICAGVPVELKLAGPVGQPGEFSLPKVDGLAVVGTGDNSNVNPPEYYFSVQPTHTGDFAIPAFDIKSDDGKRYHVLPFTLHVTKSL